MRKIKGTAVQLDINPKGRTESELERQDRDNQINRKFGKHEQAMKFILSKFADCPDDLKKFFGVD